MGENIYMLPSDMNLDIRSGTVRYNNKILVSDGKFSLGKNKVNVPTMRSHEYSKTNSLQGLAHAPNISHKNQEPPRSGTPPGSHNEETIALVLALASGFAIWNVFR